jgi:phage tail sheath protein FI
MARSTYSAPGVYVEEIPSARQPIAGVGTNTVGFIGIVPDSIYIPVANPEYDPVLAQHLMDFERLTGEDAAAARQALQRDLDRAEADLREAQDNVTRVTQARDAARTAQQTAEAAVAAAAEADRAPLDRALRRAQTTLTSAERDLTAATERLNEVTQARDQLRRQLGAAPPAPGAAPPAPGAAPPAPGAAPPAPGAAPPAPGAAPPVKVEVEDLTYDATPPDQALLVPSRFRPYYLQEFKVEVDEFDTKLCTNFTEYAGRFGSFSAFKPTPENPDDDPSKWIFKPLYPGHHLLTHAVDGFFRNGGTRCFVARIKRIDDWENVLNQFESIEDVAILAAPGLPKMVDTWGPLQDYCENDAHQNVFAILDLPAVINDGRTNDLEIEKLQYDAPDPLLPRRSTHAACYAPFIEVVDSAKLLQDSDPARQVAPKYRGRTYVAPSGHVAGIYARTDEQRGVHKAPANATVRGAIEVKYYISRPKQELLNPQGVNAIRLLDGDVTVWGARTMGGDRNAEWKYVSVRRFAGFLEESIKRGTQWVVFEPNDPSLWSRIILNITAFLTILWHNGALFGLTPQEAFYVKCDEELNPPEIRDLGQVITEIGVAIVRPAEFVIFRITQSTGPRQG